DRFAGFSAARRCPATTGLQGDGQGDALIERGRQQCGFAVARVAHHGDLFGVHRLVRDQIVHRAGHAPGPGGDGAPVVFLSPSSVVRPYALTRVRLVRFNLAVVKRGDGITAIDRLFDGPHIHLRPAAGVGRMVVGDTRTAL